MFPGSTGPPSYTTVHTISAEKNSFSLIYIFQNNFDKVDPHLVYLRHATIFQDFHAETPDFCVHAHIFCQEVISKWRVTSQMSVLCQKR